MDTKKMSAELNLLWFYWSLGFDGSWALMDMGFDGSSLQCRCSIVNMVNHTPPANASLNKTELSVWLGIITMDICWPSSEPTGTLRICWDVWAYLPVCEWPQRAVCTHWVVVSVFNSFIFLSLSLLSVFLNARVGRDFKDHSSADLQSM